MVQNKGLIYKSAPNGWPVAGQDLATEARTLDLDTACPEGGLIVKNHYLSFDPYQRGRMRASGGGYVGAFAVGEAITNRGIASVAVSRSGKWGVGDVVIVEGTGTEEYTVLARGRAEGPGVRRLENPLGLDAKMFIGALGMPGLTAWASLYEIGKPKAGETLFVSAASGAVGQLVGQLGRKEGMTVIGSVGDDAKLEYIIKELGFDGGFNYKKEKPIEALKRLCPKGIDIYYDNVGGEQLEAAITHANVYGRIIECGMISQYNLKPEEVYPIRNLVLTVGKRLKIQGFLVSDPDMGPKYAAEHNEKLSAWIKDGSFKVKMSVTKGIDHAAEGFIGMLAGRNFGKAVLEIAPLGQ